MVNDLRWGHNAPLEQDVVEAWARAGIRRRGTPWRAILCDRLSWSDIVLCPCSHHRRVGDNCTVSGKDSERGGPGPLSNEVFKRSVMSPPKVSPAAVCSVIKHENPERLLSQEPNFSATSGDNLDQRTKARRMDERMSSKTASASQFQRWYLGPA